jgi:hypothetical protein
LVGLDTRVVDDAVDRVDVLRVVNWAWRGLIFFRVFKRPLFARGYRESSFSIYARSHLLILHGSKRSQKSKAYIFFLISSDALTST